MSAARKSKAPLIIGVIVLAAIVCSLIPCPHWDHPLWPNRYVVEGEVAAIDGNEITITFYTAKGRHSRITDYGATMVIRGHVPDYCRVGESVRVAIPAESSLYEMIGKNVQVHYFKDGNLLTGMIIPAISPVQIGAPYIRLVSLDTNGTQIVYYLSESD